MQNYFLLTKPVSSIVRQTQMYPCVIDRESRIKLKKEKKDNSYFSLFMWLVIEKYFILKSEISGFSKCI